MGRREARVVESNSQVGGAISFGRRVIPQKKNGVPSEA
jgi:hypothetical protein